MIRPDLFLLGYRIFTIKEEDVLTCARLFLSRGVSVKFKNNSFLVREGRAREIERIMGTRVKFSKSEMLGFGGFLYRGRKRYGIIAALILTSILLLFSSDYVWDVRVEGYSGSDGDILDELSACGFSVGTRWSKTNLGKIEVAFLSKSEHASWVNINRRGTVAYVTVVNKNLNLPPEENVGYSNVIAECDAIIEDITVTSGVAMVKRGEVVRRGQILISGILPSELGGGFCYAEGCVIGRVSEEISVTVSAKESVKVSAGSKISSVKLNFFGFSANIFKSYRNFNKEYDIIEKSKTTRLLGRTLPVSFNIEYKELYSTSVREIPKDKLVATASEKTAAALADVLGDGTLIRIHTDGGFEDSEYKMNTQLIFTKEIGRDAPFEVK